MMRAPLLLVDWWHVPSVTETDGRTRGTLNGLYSPQHPATIWSSYERRVGQR